MIAESDAAVRVDHPDGAPLLWFPRADVAPDALDALDATSLAGGRGRPRRPRRLRPRAGRPRARRRPAGDDERDVTTKRFPTWGDAADLIDVIDVRPDGEARYVSAARSDWRRPVVEGSQMLGQAIVAAGRARAGPPGRCRRRWSSPAPPTPRAPYALELDTVSGGRTFTALGVRATQGERTCAAGTLLLDVTAPDVIRHADPAARRARPVRVRRRTTCR